MPGISVIASPAGVSPYLSARCASVRQKMLHFPSYSGETLFADGHVNIGFTGYKSYPKQIINTPGHFLVLEGMVYNHDPAALTNTLSTIADAFLLSGKTLSGVLREFLLNADGEFILTLYDKVNRRLLFAGDLLGRLPLYYHRTESALIFSRELKFIIPFLDRPTYNRTAILEYLLYGYPFEENTFIKEVGFFPAASFLFYDLKTGASVKEAYYTLNLEHPAKKEERPEIVATMRKLFLEATANRLRATGNKKVIVSLSGGLDSRATLAGLTQLGCQPTAVTAADDEEGLARKVAGAMGVETYTMPQGQTGGALNYEDIVFLKDGLDCHPNLAQLYDNLENLRARFGEDTVYYTGIYGGEITRHSHPTGGLKSIDALSHYLLNAHDSGKCSTESVADLLQLSAETVSTRLSTRLKAFPETGAYKKYLRFRHECDVRFAGEAEDRNRYYFWTISPYLSPAFFHYVMSIDENRKNTRLFRDFLFAIDKNTCAIRYYNYRLPLTSTTILKAFSLVERVARHRWFKNGMRRMMLLKKAVKKLLPRLKTREEALLHSYRTQLLSLLHKPSEASRFFNHPGLAANIHREMDSQGLDRLNIVLVYLNRVEKWRDAFR